MPSWMSLRVPGRLCLVGEHSDWSGGRRSVDPSLGIGYAIVAATRESLRACVRGRKDGFLVLSSSLGGARKYTANELLAAARDTDNTWRYAAGVAYVVFQRYGISGLQAVITSDLPAGKGLSSSASVCVCIARGFNRAYGLRLSTAGEMDLAYAGERITGSLCGRMDQCVAFGPGTVANMSFDGEVTTHEVLTRPIAPVYIVFADLATSKDTSIILFALQGAVSRKETNEEIALERFLSVRSREVVDDVAEALKAGDASRMGRLFSEAQAAFDAAATPMCPAQLVAPRLHQVMEDPRVAPMIYGAKGVGSQGDGSVQFVARSKDRAKQLVEVLKEMAMPNAYILTLGEDGDVDMTKGAGDVVDKPPIKLPVLRTVKTAVITAAGYGTRLFPASRSIRPKSLMPVFDEDGFVKPLLLSIVELCVQEDMERIVIVCGPDDVDKVRQVFKPIDPDSGLGRALKPWMRTYAESIGELEGKVEVVVQKTPEGFGDAVTKAAGLVRSDPFVLLLGDVIFKSGLGDPTCLRQCLDVFQRDPSARSVIGVSEVPVADAGAYGVVNCREADNLGALEVSQIQEKPSKRRATELSDDGMCKIVLGPYVFSNRVMAALLQDVAANARINGEIQLTPALSTEMNEAGLLAVLLEGDALDTGNPTEYASTMAALSKCILDP